MTTRCLPLIPSETSKMADVSLLALALLALILSAPALIDTKNILRLDVAGGLLTLTWLLPQAYALRDDPFSWYYDLSFTYSYIFVCISFLALGSLIGRRSAQRRLEHQPIVQNSAMIGHYDPKKLADSAIIMAVLGGVAFVLMAREAQNFGVQDQWTGVITLYFLLNPDFNSFFFELKSNFSITIGLLTLTA